MLRNECEMNDHQRTSFRKNADETAQTVVRLLASLGRAFLLPLAYEYSVSTRMTLSNGEEV